MNRLRSMVRKVPIRRKLMGMILLTTCVALLVSATAFFAYELVTFRQVTVRSLTATADVVGANCAAALVFEEAASVETTLRSLSVEPQIVSAAVYDRRGQIVARYQRNPAEAVARPAPPPAHGTEFRGGHLIVTRPIQQQGDAVGSISLQADLAPLVDRAKSYLAVTGVALGFALLAGFALSLRLQVLISRPIVHLTGVAGRVAAERNYALRAEKFDDDEIGELIGDFNRMLGEIQERDVALQRARDELEERVEERTRQLRTSEAFYQSLVQSMPLNMFRKDTQGRFTFCNHRFCATLGRLPEEIIGRTDADFFPADLTAKYREDDIRIIQTGVQFETVEVHQPEGQDRRYVEVIKTPLADPDGRVVAIQGLFWDVTEKKRAEAELAYERDLLRTLLDHSPDRIYFKDDQGRFLKVSRAFGLSCGTAAETELLGRTDFDLFAPEHAGSSRDDDLQVMRTGDPIVGKVEREVWKDGHVTWVLTSKMPFRNKAGETVGTFGISKDITEMKKAEQDLESMHKQLLETSRRAGMAEVATGVLHNVGNVLNSVNVTTTLLKDHVRNSRLGSLGKAVALIRDQNGQIARFFTEDARGRQLPDFLAKLTAHLQEEQVASLRELDSLAHHIDHIKEIVAMQQAYARVSGVREVFSAAELLDDALRMNAAALVRHDVQVVKNYDPAPALNVEKNKVLQILINLVSNAKYACDAGGNRPKTLTLCVAHPDPGQVLLSVTDNGIGIPPENLTRIFELGFTTKRHGHGFGLHSSANAARELGGALAVQSDGPGRGATFTLTLPAEPRPLPP